MADENLKNITTPPGGQNTGGPRTATDPATVPVQPLDPLSRVTSAIDEFGRTSGIDAKKLEQLRTLITAAVDERASEIQDIRIGRVLGSALAML